MTLRRNLIIFLFYLTSEQVFGQDTTIYCQANASLFSNCYNLFRTNQNEKQGTFEWTSGTDDGGEWYGKGIFKETKQKYLLTYEKLNDSTRVQFSENKVQSDTLLIRWFDINGQQEFFSIRIGDTTVFEQIDTRSDLMKIPKSKIKNSKLSFLVWNKVVFDFIVPSSAIDTATIYYHQSRIHDLNKTSETIRKTKNGVIAKAMWTKERKTLFTKRNT